MSEEIIAAIEAPRRAAGLVGHAPAARLLADAWQGGRLAHGWLVAGPQGIGKATLAWRFARTVLAVRPAGEGLATDPADPGARQVIAGSHPDMRLVRRSHARKAPYNFRTEIAVDDIRDLGPFLHQTAARGGWRVIVVDAADDMNRNAQNALLKLLEEPPARTVFLLVAHAPSRLLPTIRSRCRTLLLRPLADADVLAVLEERRAAAQAALAEAVDEEGVLARTGLPTEAAKAVAGLDDATMAGLARLADGAPGRALALAAAGGLAVYAEMMTLLGTLPALDGKRLAATTDRFGGNAGEPAFRAFADLVQWWLSRAVRAAACGERPPEIVAGEEAVRARLLGLAAPAAWAEAAERLATLFARGDGLNLDRKQLAMDAVFTLAETVRR
ncbi:MAG: DNA polymerase III subunit delta' [Alphaproteobacteria bacterium]